MKGGPGGSRETPRGGLGCVWAPKAGAILGPGSGARASVSPLVAALPTVNTRPPEGAPPGTPDPPQKGPKRAIFGHFGAPPEKGPKKGVFWGGSWGVRTRWGQNQANRSLTVVYRGGRGAPPKAHWVRSRPGPPNRVKCVIWDTVTSLLRSIAPCLSSRFFQFVFGTQTQNA